MSDVQNNHTRLLDRTIDFVVLGATFFVSCMVLSVESGSGLLFQMMVYSTILLVFVRLSKRVIASYNKSIGETTCQVLGNATGILIGTCVVLLLESLVSAISPIFGVVIFSGVMAFFILGTLSPIVHKIPLAHK